MCLQRVLTAYYYYKYNYYVVSFLNKTYTTSTLTHTIVKKINNTKSYHHYDTTLSRKRFWIFSIHGFETAVCLGGESRRFRFRFWTKRKLINLVAYRKALPKTLSGFQYIGGLFIPSSPSLAERSIPIDVT